MTKEMITMSHRELDRIELIRAAVSCELKQIQVAERLQLSTRQVKRLVRNYRRGGAKAILCKRRGNTPNNAIAASVRNRAIALLREDRYKGFAPTLAHEKLTEQHAFIFSVETLRQWMMADGLWVPKQRARARIHQSRPRRPCEGELVQIDGSPHAWFEERGPECTLIVFIDDATSRLKALGFAPSETTKVYMETLDDDLTVYGRPVAFYSDKHSIFRVNHPDCEGELTQFTRALKTLDIEPIHANTPQAKGRVERANKTLQDRLVKELRLRAINTIEEANAFLPAFMADYNRRFGKAPAQPNNAHRPVLHSRQELNLILCRHHQRKLSKNLCFQFQNREYQLQGYGNGYRLRGASVTVCEAFNGDVTVMYEGKSLAHRILQQREAAVTIADEKTVHHLVAQAQQKQQANLQRKPAPDHPWRRSPIGSAARL